MKINRSYYIAQHATDNQLGAKNPAHPIQSLLTQLRTITKMSRYNGFLGPLTTYLDASMTILSVPTQELLEITRVAENNLYLFEEGFRTER